ncbi:hypothetical protein [Microbacterium sp. bgisy189]|uniref:hypothetical protein n=1 Tax=Microbacterium sp. bgisy189 TaxID=3413798 RepID=UPI003EBDABB2
MLSGCGTIEPEIVVATYDPSGEGGFGSGIEGRLVVDVDGCLAVDLETGERVVPVFPAPEIAVDGDLVSYRGDDLTGGDAVTLPGGFSEVSELPDACEGAGETFVVGNRG